MNNITLAEIRKLNDEKILQLCKEFIFPSQWKNEDALAHAQYTLALMQGRNYVRTGNVKSFSRRFFQRGGKKNDI